MHLFPALIVMMVGSLLIRTSFLRRMRQRPGMALARIIDMVASLFGITIFLRAAGMVWHR